VIDFITWSKGTLRPGNVAFLLGMLSIVAALSYLRPRWGRRLLVALIGAYWFISSPFGSGILIAPLVDSYQPLQSGADAPAARAIVVLGGGIRDFKVMSGALAYPFEATTLRILEGARVYRLLDGSEHPLMVASGGITNVGGESSEASVIADGLTRLGVPREQILTEDRSMTTREQAIEVTGLLRGRGVGRFVIVTNPTHMRRSLASFRALGADVVPSVSALLPERRRIPGLFTPNDDSFAVSDAAIYDYAALGYYWARGWLRPTPPEGRP
jgi:uncharacterized SAM-binding protein YcdF (DUF218 family)